MIGTAQFSECGRWRYALTRSWRDEDPLLRPVSAVVDPVLFVLCNPSTATAEQDDPTIRKCIGFAKRWGHDGLTVVNVFAIRATDPEWVRLLPPAGRIGPDNDRVIEQAAWRHRTIVAAWGALAPSIDADRVAHVRKLIGPRLVCLKKSKDGHPWHPLYVPYSKEPELFA